NHSNEEVQKWFKNVGMRKTYEQYVKNGYYLPSWDAYIGNEKNSIPIQNVKDLIGDLIPIHDYRFENLSKILFDVPIETQAAFWNNTFYFQDNVNKLQIGEEVFHALFQTIFDTNTRNSLFSIAKRNINLKEEVKKYSELFPSIMNPLSQQQKEERVMEEWLATQFRNWYAYNKDNVTSREEQVNKLSSRYKSIPKKLIEILYDFFDVLRQLFNLSVRDKRYLDSLFQNIINGEYKDSQYQPSETSTPLLSVLKYTQNGRQ